MKVLAWIGVALFVVGLVTALVPIATMLLGLQLMDYF